MGGEKKGAPYFLKFCHRVDRIAPGAAKSICLFRSGWPGAEGLGLGVSTEISIVIPTRNEERVIEETLRQFQTLKQRHGLEVIVSDGGSDDATVAIARRYADKLVAQPRQKTIAVGRNAGALAATGDLLFHTDADVRFRTPRTSSERSWLPLQTNRWWPSPAGFGSTRRRSCCATASGIGG
ncbi:MAG: glycosyltransferase [Deltaproteobacteria bacterium]|nr:glycosyltransferase [Deltaproteobacteria bacterium]MBW2444479.1 glycosyltransferase [Deltaproteobacteria bacterium]